MSRKKKQPNKDILDAVTAQAKIEEEIREEAKPNFTEQSFFALLNEKKRYDILVVVIDINTGTVAIEETEYNDLDQMRMLHVMKVLLTDTYMKNKRKYLTIPEESGKLKE